MQDFSRKNYLDWIIFQDLFAFSENLEQSKRRSCQWKMRKYARRPLLVQFSPDYRRVLRALDREDRER